MNDDHDDLCGHVALPAYNGLNNNLVQKRLVCKRKGAQTVRNHEGTNTINVYNG